MCVECVCLLTANAKREKERKSGPKKKPSQLLLSLMIWLQQELESDDSVN